MKRCVSVIRYVRVSMIPAFALLLFTFACERGEVIETIGGHDLRTKEYEEYYSTSVDLASRVSGADKSVIAKLVCNKESSVSKTLRPQNHYDRYRDSLMVARVAEDEGFLDDPNVQRMLEQNRLQTIGQLYINAKLLQAVDNLITEEAKLKVCEALRKKEPKKMAPLSLNDCLAVSERFIKKRLISQKSKEVIKDIRESVAIKRNLKFDQKQYFNKLPAYVDLKKEGGCAGSSSLEESKSKK